jgi:ABC-2 type transport system permease protein
VNDDILTMIWKEYREFDRITIGSAQSSSKTTNALRRLLPLLLISVWIPLRSKEAWVSNTSSLVSMIFVPLFFTMFVVVDSFAGERERHTLETLLATRLSDEAILLGKVAATVTYALTRVLIYLVVGLVTVNVLYGHGHLLMFSAQNLVALFVFAFLLVTMIAGAGVLVSLRAPSVQQASRNLSLGFTILMFASIFAWGQISAEWRDWAMKTLFTSTLAQTEIAAGLFLLVVDILLVSIAKARFQRSRLILD